MQVLQRARQLLARLRGALQQLPHRLSAADLENEPELLGRQADALVHRRVVVHAELHGIAEDRRVARALARFLEQLADLHLHGLRAVRHLDGVADHERPAVGRQHRRRRRDDVVPDLRFPPHRPPAPQPKPRRHAPLDLQRGQVDAARQEREQLPRREMPQASLEDDCHLWKV